MTDKNLRKKADYAAKRQTETVKSVALPPFFCSSVGRLLFSFSMFFKVDGVDE
jgi:membrane protein CcdC involved in cytochrome C biogenesis